MCAAISRPRGYGAITGLPRHNRCDQGNRAIREFAKSSLINLIAAQLPPDQQARGQSVARGVDPIRNALVPAQIKRDLLNDLFASGGAKAILTIGQNLDRVSHDPIWAAALSSADPWILLEKWHRFERFAHWNNRTKIERLSDTRLHMRRYAVDGTTPTMAENLMVCGLLVGLLGRVGCRQIDCDLGARNPARIVRSGCLVVSGIDPADTAEWAISWVDHQSPREPIVMPDKLQDLIERYGLSGVGALAVRQLHSDPSRSWSLATLASACHMSRRTLQRRLHEADLSFSKIVRMVRVHEACHLLQTTDMPATAIGFCAGFSDSAHFSRDFSASTGVAPSAFRQLMRLENPPA